MDNFYNKKSMDMESKFGLMEQFIKVIGFKIKQMERELFIIIMEINIKDNFLIKKQMDMVFIFIVMVLFIKENGNKICRKAMENKFGLTDQNIKEILKKD